MTLFVHYLRRTWKLGVLASIALFAFHVIIVRVFVSVSSQADRMLLGRTMPQWAQNFFGLDQLQIGTLSGFLAIAYQHPFVIVGVLSVPVAIASALLAREVETRTIVLLLSRPVARVNLILSTLMTCWVWSAFMITCSMLGTIAGARLFHVEQLPAPDLFMHVAFSLLSLSMAVGAMATMFSAISSQRGDAVGWSLTVVLIMYVWNFIAQVWPEVARSGQYSLFHYYQPARILLRASVLTYDYQVLGITAAVCTVISLIVYAVRDFNA